jgi:acetone carboxylase gamma subunit
MTKNTTEAMQEVVKNLLVALEQIKDCSELDCDSCPLLLNVIEEDPRYGRHNCGWLLLKSATSKIMRR